MVSWLSARNTKEDLISHIHQVVVLLAVPEIIISHPFQASVMRMAQSQLLAVLSEGDPWTQVCVSMIGRAEAEEFRRPDGLRLGQPAIAFQSVL